MQAEIAHLRKDQEEVLKELKALRTEFSELKGGKRVLLVVFATLGSVVTLGAQYLMGKH